MLSLQRLPLRRLLRPSFNSPLTRQNSTKPAPPSDPRFSAPGPLPLGDSKAQKEFEQLIKQHNDNLSSTDTHPDAEKEPISPEFEGEKNPITGEIGGPKGKEPTRYGDWERKGRVYDF
ncbi:hypothetical protein HDV00_001848 [Rhizophlyctis rosea]|nr:hypothetical protein HDV00_001848 [Rhizophlyctis rosea]